MKRGGKEKFFRLFIITVDYLGTSGIKVKKHRVTRPTSSYHQLRACQSRDARASLITTHFPSSSHDDFY